VLAIWVADLLRRWLADRSLWRAATREATLVLVVLPCIMWLAGYFCLGYSDARTPNSAGAYSMNLLSPIDSRGFSPLLPAMPLERAGQIEGAAYLGLGVLVLAGITLLVLPRRRKSTAAGTNWTPLLIVCAILILFAISPIITCGNMRLVALPNYWGGISETLRATGRMSWVAVYVLPLLLIAALAARLSARSLTAVLASVLAIQILDLTPMLQATSRHFRTSAPPIRTLSDPLWTDAAKHRRRIILVPSDAPGIDWYPLAFFAADHGMPINHGYFARMDWNRKEAANEQVVNDLQSGRWDPVALYVLTTDQARSLVPQQRLRDADGYSVVLSPD
jgi:hypothetical protein